jgi:hypothetical protein
MSSADPAGSAMSDVLEVGDPGARRWPGRTALVLLVVLTLLAGALLSGAWWLDHNDRHKTFNRLLTCVNASQSALAYGSAQLSMINNYIQPALRPDVTPELEAGLYRMVAQTAQRALPSIEHARTGCRNVSVHRWQTGLRTARTGYLSYLDARIAELVKAGADGKQAFADQPELDELRDRARDQLIAAAPDHAQALRAQQLLTR